MTDKPTYEELLKKVEFYEKREKEMNYLKTSNGVDKTKQYFENLINYANAPIIVWNAHFEIQLFNKAFERLTSYSAENVIGKTLHFLFPEKSISKSLENINHTLSGDFWETIEIPILCKNGETRIVLWNSANIYDKDNKTLLSTIAQGNDITERKNSELELVKSKDKAEESDRLKTAFLQNMSHEIRTPLNAISGFSGMLNKPELSEDKRKSFISIIQNSSKQLVSIVSDILTISSIETKQEKQNIDKVCINNIIIDLLSIFKQQAQNQNISLYAKQQLSDKQSEIYTDKTKVTQILTSNSRFDL